MKHLRKLLFLVPVALSLFLLLSGFTQQAFAASRLAEAPSGKAVSLTSGGGCTSWTPMVTPPVTDRVCISEDAAREIDTDAYLSTSSPGDYTYFIIEVDLLDSTTGTWTNAITHNLTYPYGHWYGPTIPAVAGHHYIAYTAWYARITNGTKFIYDHIDHSPVQVA